MLIPRGRLRHRDFCFRTTANRQLVPKDIYTVDCPFFHPEDILKDHICDSKEFYVEMYDEIPVDPQGTPMFSKWSFIAFHMSKSREEERSSKSSFINFCEELRECYIGALKPL